MVATHTAAGVADGNTGLQVRWFQSGTGFIQSLPMVDTSANTAPTLVIPTNSARPIKLRAQLWRDGMPIEEPSRPLTMVTSGSLSDCIFAWGERSVSSAASHFNWAEATYPAHFPANGVASKNVLDYYYRYYPATNTFLASSSVDDSLYYFAASSGKGVVNLGDLAIWKAQSGCN